MSGITFQPSAAADSAAGSRFFEPSKLVGLERMRFTTRNRVEGLYSGRHVARQRGGSGEFVDYREYAPGDDLRRLDWKALGRTGRSYLKLYQDETDLHCTLLVDCSGSMLQGSNSNGSAAGSKLEWAKYFCTALAHLIVLRRDAIGLAAARNRLENYVAPAATMQQRSLIHQQLEQLSASGTTDLAAGLDDLLLLVKRQGVLLMLSDFLVDEMDRVIGSLRKFRARGWEIIALQIVHPDEERLPEGNAYRFTGWEHDGHVSCQVAEVRKAYQQRFSQHLRDTRNALVAAGCDYQLVSTQRPYIELLRSFLVARSA